LNALCRRSDRLRCQLELLGDLNDVLIDQGIVDSLIALAVAQASVDDCLHGLSPSVRLPRRLA
jgi:hypothetical protein